MATPAPLFSFDSGHVNHAEYETLPYQTCELGSNVALWGIRDGQGRDTPSAADAFLVVATHARRPRPFHSSLSRDLRRLQQLLRIEV